MTIRNELIDELLAGQDPASVMRQEGLLGELKKALLNRLMAGRVRSPPDAGSGGRVQCNRRTIRRPDVAVASSGR
jgi:hypothetical protein